MSAIHLHEVLSRMQSNPGEPFTLEFVRALDGRGGNKGSIKKGRYYFGAPNPRDRQAPKPIGHRQPRRTNLESNTIYLTDLESKQLTTPHLSHLLTYNGRKIYR